MINRFSMHVGRSLALVWLALALALAATASSLALLLPLRAQPVADRVALAYCLLVAAGLLLSWLGFHLRGVLRLAEMAGRAMAESEHRYRILVEDQSELVALLDPHGRLSFANHALASLVGRDADQLVGCSLLDCVHADEQGALKAHLETVRQRGQLASLEIRMQAADGSGPRWVAWTLRRLASAGASLPSIHCVGRDVTEYKTLEAALTAKAKEIEDLYEHAPCGYHSLGANGIYLKINATELEWLGCAREDVLGKLGPHDFLGPVDRDVLMAAFARAKSELTAQRVDVRLVGRHGMERDVSIDVSVVLDDDGTFLMTRSVMFDVTDLYQARRALLRLNIEQRAMLECELFGIARISGAMITWANTGFHRIVGYPPGALHGAPVSDLHAGQPAYVRFQAEAQPILATGATWRGQLPMRRQDGELIWVELSGVQLDAETHESLWLYADITARKQAERALRNSQAMLERTGALAGVGGWEYDVPAGVLKWTAETCQLHGVAPDFEPELDAALAFYTPAMRPLIQSAVARALETGEGYDLELEIERADGTRRWVRTTASVEQVDGRSVRVFGALQDVSAKVEQIARIEHLYRLSEQQREELAMYRDRAVAEADIASFLLSRLSRVEQLEQGAIQYHLQPADAFSGDVIGVARSSAGDTYGMLADATGHGLAAAINLIPLTSAFYAMAEKGFGVGFIAESLNKVVKDYSLPDRFVAVTLCCVRHREQRLEVVNAGNPAALLLDSARRVQREFRSGCVPLGILGDAQFRPQVESLEWQGDEAVLMFSDGLVEAANHAGEAFGRVGLDAVLSAAQDLDHIAVTLRTQLAAHVNGVAPADDVSLLVLPLAHGDGLPASALPDWSAMEAHTGSGIVGKDGRWGIELHLTSSELRHLEVVPEVVDLARSFRLDRSVESALFTVLSELCQNALEHGLLRLDSGIKSQDDGFERYMSLREERLATLTDAELVVRVIHRNRPGGGGQLRISVQDSGPGFDHQAKLAAATSRSLDGPGCLPSGRGLTLIARLCESVQFNTAGNQVTVDLAYR